MGSAVSAYIPGTEASQARRHRNAVDDLDTKIRKVVFSIKRCRAKRDLHLQKAAALTDPTDKALETRAASVYSTRLERLSEFLMYFFVAQMLISENELRGEFSHSVGRLLNLSVESERGLKRYEDKVLAQMENNKSALVDKVHAFATKAQEGLSTLLDSDKVGTFDSVEELRNLYMEAGLPSVSEVRLLGSGGTQEGDPCLPSAPKADPVPTDGGKIQGTGEEHKEVQEPQTGVDGVHNEQGLDAGRGDTVACNTGGV